MKCDEKGSLAVALFSMTIDQSPASFLIAIIDMKSPSDEVQWTDDSIRWEGGLHGDIKQEEGSDDDEDCMIDPFK